MNKKPFLKLLLLSMSLVACGQKNNSAGEDTSSKSSTSNVQSSVKESVKTASSSAENTVKNKQEDKDIQKNPQQEVEKNPQQEATEKKLFDVVTYNTVPEVCEYDLDGTYVTTRIQPLIVTGRYLHYDVKNKDNIYIDVILNVKNLNNEAKIADDIITAKMKIKNNEYTCFSVAESADSSNLENHALMKPLEKRQIHYVAEVPMTEATGEMELILTINGNNFSREFNLKGL